MHEKISHVLHVLLESYVFVLLAALTLGIAFPKFFQILSPYGTLFLGIIFFLSSIRTDMGVLFSYFSKIRALLVVNAFMLLVLGVIVFYLSQWLYPGISIAFLLLASMPSGMTSPFITSIVGGREDFALVLALSTSLLAPFTIPLLFFILVGKEIDVSFLSMFWLLVKVLVIPFILARIAHKILGTEKLNPTFVFYKPFSLFLLGVIISSVVASHHTTIVLALTTFMAIKYIVLLILFFLLTFFLGYFLTPWLSREERVTVTNGVVFLNFTLAIFLAGKFFNTPEVVVPVVLSMLVWSLSIIPWEYVVRRFILS